MTKRKSDRTSSNSSISSRAKKRASKRMKASKSSIRSLPKKAFLALAQSGTGKTQKLEKGRSRHRVVAANGKTYLVQAVKCLRGGKYIRVSDDDGAAYVPYDQFAGAASEAMQTLRAAGVIVIGSKTVAAIRDAVAMFGTKDFKRKPLLDRAGWTKRYFALPSGEVFSPTGLRKAVALFPTTPGLCRQAGKASHWKRGVAGRLTGQQLASFTLMTPFATPILALAREVGNFGFEITGARGNGKSTLLQILASTSGYPFPSPDGHYGMSMNATVNGLEVAMQDYADLVMPMDEATLFEADGSGSARAAAFLGMVFRSSDGTTKSRMSNAKQKVLRFIPVISGNEAIAEVLDKGRGKVRAAAADRLLTLKVGDDRPFGVFDFMPPGFANGGELAAAIKRTIGKHYGMAIRRFLKMLVTECARDKPKLKGWIAKQLANFRAQVGVDYNDGSASRVADAFGLVGTGGLLAQRYKILPANFDCMAAAEACYRLHFGSARLLPAFRDRLMQLASRSDVVDLDAVGLSKMSKKERDCAPAYLRTNRSGQRELLLTTKARQRAFPDWLSLRGTLEVLELLVSDKKRKKVKRPLRANKSWDWVYCFVLPEE